MQQHPLFLFGCLGHCAAASTPKCSLRLFCVMLTRAWQYNTATRHCVYAFLYQNIFIYTTYLLIYLNMYIFLPFACARVCACIADLLLHTITICMNIILIILHFIALTFRLNALACIIIMVMGFQPLIHEFKRKCFGFLIKNFELVSVFVCVCEHACPNLFFLKSSSLHICVMCCLFFENCQKYLVVLCVDQVDITKLFQHTEKRLSTLLAHLQFIF